MPCALREVELKVVAPNWLLDPKRAVWLRTKPAEEMRVCWAVHCLTRPGTEEITLKKLLPPQIVIYIDAATGEAVGAGFS